MHAKDLHKPSSAEPHRDPQPRNVAPQTAAAGLDLGGMSPQSVLALQRSIGNAAVSRLVEQSQHQHGAGCGHGEPTAAPVQRSTVHDVLSTGGQPMAAPVRAEMENRLGADFSDVRIHNDGAARASASEIGARAYTSGNHVVIGDGGGDRHTLAHELTHVIQQRQGPVAGTDQGDGTRVSDPSDRFEQAAEANARRVMSGPAVQRAVTPEAQAGTGEPVIQRAPLNVTTRQGQALDSDNEDAVLDYALGSLADGDRESVDLLLRRLRKIDPLPPYIQEIERSFNSAHDRRPTIPAKVHFIWIGGAISDAAFDNVMKWAAKAKNTDWHIHIWTDKNSKWTMSRSATVKFAQNISFQSIESALDDRLKASYTEATTKPQKAYPTASDIARYSILKKHGGVYADVDLGAGEVVLQTGSAPKLRQNDPPVLGPLIRDKQSLDGALVASGQPRSGEKPTRQQIKAAATHLLHTGGYGNHFIAAQKDSQVIEAMITRVANSIEGMDAEEMHMAGPVSTGPFPLMAVVDAHLQREFGISDVQAGEHGAFQSSGTHFHDNMEWLTSESENQNY